ncbi:uncharacterized protein N7459_009509 [Penicillium hispanicum]|uniref:uncharacterized protein n=1 Tax=Penicillium hispanicum TaxID=1080232 RepID=UPI0025402A3B|nr:uncharacterized protein N7459_009509 [Penicillium hispanicum]KAJ5570079.1 hypothetical protein N7459_009509 [Penicillium hispanicum]
MDDSDESSLYTPKHPLEFRLGSRLVVAAKVELLDPRHTVYRLDLKQPPFLALLQPILALVPWIKAQPLQGTVIPYFYGETVYETSPTLVLSYIAGTNLFELARQKFPKSEDSVLEQQIAKALGALASYRVEYLNQKLANFLMLDDGRVMIVDLEKVVLNTTEHLEESTCLAIAGSLMRLFIRVRDPTYSLPASAYYARSRRLKSNNCDIATRAEQTDPSANEI